VEEVLLENAIEERAIPNERVVHNGVRNHQYVNSESFHATYCNRVKLHEIDGLVVHSVSGSYVGASNFKSHSQLEPLLYRDDGLWFQGRPAQLLALLTSLPGTVSVPWEAVEDKHRLMIGIFPNRVQSEKTLARHLTSLVTEIRVRVEPAANSCAMADEVLLGAYGVVAYSDRSVTPSTYAPERAAILGSCDIVFRFGDRSGAMQGRDLSVVELKMFSPVDTSDYHEYKNSICAQIHASFFGSDAPVAMILGNGVGKCFWKEKQANCEYKFYTYPSGNDMLDFDLEADRLFFLNVMYHLVRCSLQMGDESRVNKRTTKRKLNHTTEREPGAFATADAADIKEVAKNSEELFKDCPPAGKKTFFARMVSGVRLELGAVDLSNWTKEQRTRVLDQLTQQEENDLQ
jgi:hypothetical protein